MEAIKTPNDMSDKSDKILEELQLEYLSGVTGTKEEKLKRLPLSDSGSIAGLIWNLLTNDYWRSKLSIELYNEVFKTLIQSYAEHHLEDVLKEAEKWIKENHSVKEYKDFNNVIRHSLAKSKLNGSTELLNHLKQRKG